MIIDIIIFGVLILSVLVIVIIIGRKFPTLAAIDTQATAGPIAERKHSLIEDRLRRKVVSWWGRVVARSTPVALMTGKAWTTAHKKLVDLEHEYKVRSLPVFLSGRHRRKIDKEIKATMAQAIVLMDEKEYPAAEEKILQTVRLEPRSVPAFELLGELYMLTKEYGHAKEVYSYLLKLTGDSDAIYEHLGEADMAAGHFESARNEPQRAVYLNRSVAVYHSELAQVYSALSDSAKAFVSIQEAVRLEPNNPKLLDQYVEISIAAGKKQFAEDAIARIAAVNPENSKIGPWREQLTLIRESNKTTSTSITEVTNPPT